MDSPKVPIPLQQQSDNLLCDICNLDFKSRHLRNEHYRIREHQLRARDLAKCLFGYRLRNDVTCLDEIYNDPKRKGSFIGLQYLKEGGSLTNELSFKCRLCGVACATISQHVLSMKHMKKYIKNDFSFLFEDVDRLSVNVIPKIAEIIESVEGLQKVKMSMNTPVEHTMFLEYPDKETLDRIVEQLKIRSIDFKNPYQDGTVPGLATGSHVYGIIERNSKRLLRFKPRAVFKRSKPELSTQNEGKPIVSLSRPAPVPFSVSHTSEGNKMNENNSLPATNFPAASYVPTVNNDMARKPIPTLCKSNKITCPQIEKHVPSCQAADSFFKNETEPLPSTSLHRSNNITWPQVEKPVPSLHPAAYFYQNERTSLPIPSLCTSNKITRPQVEKHVPSWQPAESFNQNAVYGDSYYSDQSTYEFANKSGYGQAKSVSDGRPTYAVEGQTRGEETGHPGAKHLHPLETMHGSVSSSKSSSGQCSTEASLKQDTPSHYSYNSVDVKELTSKSYLPSGTMSVLNNEPSLPMSHRDIHHSDGLPATTSTSSCAQTSQGASVPAKIANVLSPHTIKILQGRDPTSVKSILKRLSEYCPELQQVNISLLVDGLFETGALSWVPV